MEEMNRDDVGSESAFGAHSSPPIQPDDGDRVAAILAYVPFMCFYALFTKKDDAYAFHHGKQGFVLFLAEIIAIALRWDILWNLLLIILGAVAIWAMVAASRGELFRLPVVSDYLDQYKP